MYSVQDVLTLNILLDPVVVHGNTGCEQYMICFSQLSHVLL